MLRSMQASDLDAVAAIERAAPSPWSRDSLAQELERQGDLQFVVEDDVTGAIVAWCCGRQTGPEAELLKISVHPAQRHGGIASGLMAHLIREFSLRGAIKLFLEVRAGNLPALKLYRKYGLAEIGRRKKYYTDPEDDALLFTGDLLCAVFDKT